MHDSMDGRHLGDEIRERETMLWFSQRPYGERRVNVRANTIHSLMRAGLIREQETEITGAVRTSICGDTRCRDARLLTRPARRRGDLRGARPGVLQGGGEVSNLGIRTKKLSRAAHRPRRHR
jgi:hypothetical protein